MYSENKMASYADTALLMGAENRPPMLTKATYDHWKSRMVHYVLNRPNGRMLLQTLQHGPIVIPPVLEANGTSRERTYDEMSEAQKTEYDAAEKAINILLQAVPPEIYAVIHHYQTAKEMWDNLDILMRGTTLTKQERECQLYDEFDKFSYVKGETLSDYHWRFSLLLSKMYTYNIHL